MRIHQDFSSPSDDSDREEKKTDTGYADWRAQPARD